MSGRLRGTLQYLDAEITRLRNKRMKLPLENVELGEMQKVQNKNEMLIREYLASTKIGFLHPPLHSCVRRVRHHLRHFEPWLLYLNPPLPLANDHPGCRAPSLTPMHL